jgi:hypothetical protein
MSRQSQLHQIIPIGDFDAVNTMFSYLLNIFVIFLEIFITSR